MVRLVRAGVNRDVHAAILAAVRDIPDESSGGQPIRVPPDEAPPSTIGPVVNVRFGA